MAEGYDVKQSEVHGMSQRGGSVTSHLRFGDKVWTPLVTPGTVDILLAFESLEALRYVHWLQARRPARLQRLQRQPQPGVVRPGRRTRPTSTERIAAAWPNVRAVDASALAAAGRHRQGGQRGHAGRRGRAPCPSAGDLGERSSAGRCRPRRVDVNLEAFRLGREVGAVAV